MLPKQTPWRTRETLSSYKSHLQEQQAGKKYLNKPWRKGRQLEQEWNDFQPLMQSNLFHTTAFVAGYNQLCTLMDPGPSIYASTAETHANRLKLKTLDTPPRTVTGFLNNVTGTISKVATFSLDIGGIHNLGIRVCINESTDRIKMSASRRCAFVNSSSN